MDLTEESLQDVKEALASLFLTTLDFGKYLLVMRSECDLIIREEPYIAYMLWLNVESGQIISRTWNKTICTGYITKLYQLVHACQIHFMSGRPCLGLPQCGIKSGYQEYVTSQTPVPTRFSDGCLRTIAEPSVIGVYSCSECLKLDVDETNSSHIFDSKIVTTEQEGIKEESSTDCVADIKCNTICVNPVLENTNSDSQIEGDVEANVQAPKNERVAIDSKSTNQPRSGIKCPLCPKFLWNHFSGQEMLQKHLKLKHSWGVFQCEQCQHKAYFLEDLIDHLNNSGHKVNVKCPQCKGVFSTERLKSHYNACLTRVLKPYAREMKRCPWCYKSFRIKASLQNHLKLVHSWGSFQCLQCEFTADFIKDLRQHIALEEHKPNNEIQCPQCKVKFTTEDIENHYSTCVSQQVIDCPWCTKVFDKDDMYKFELHRKREHFWGNFSCHLCRFETNFANDLKEHIDGKGLKEDTCVTCPECKDEFPFLEIQTHYKTCVFRTIDCPWCYKQFKGTDSGSLSHHKKLKHFWGVFRCIQCKHRANFARDLIKHMEEEEHMENPYTSCPNCNKDVPIHDLGSHYEVCVIEKHTKCQWCNEKCGPGGGLYSHMKKVHFWGNFKCPQCGDKFKFAKDLVDHMHLEPHVNSVLEDVKINCPHCANQFVMNDIASHYQECVTTKYKMTKCYKCNKRLQREEVLSHQDVCEGRPLPVKSRKIRALVRVPKAQWVRMKTFRYEARKYFLRSVVQDLPTHP